MEAISSSAQLVLGIFTAHHSSEQHAPEASLSSVLLSYALKPLPSPGMELKPDLWIRLSVLGSEMADGANQI